MAFCRWEIANTEQNTIRAIQKECGVERLTALALAARGHGSGEAAEAYFAREAKYESPFAMLDMDTAAERIHAAIEKGERIAVFGDYDVDGVTATALLVQFLQSIGGDAVCSLPTRESTTGYGLSCDAIDNLKKYDVALIVTVDNGVSSYDEVAYAKTLGIDVVVCDHHLPPPRLPDAVAIVDPLRLGDESTYKDLAGVGVALKLAAAVEDCEFEELLEMYGYLAAVGTISDIMPLTGENRSIVEVGLQQLREGISPGLSALCAACELELSAIDAQKIAFTLAPRLNAAGRMGDAGVALQLLLSEDPEEAAALAAQLLELNSRRRDAEADVAIKIAKQIENDPALLRDPVLILAGEDLHAGVTGIACSRMVERFGKPVMIISIEGDDAKGSGRSVPGFSIYDAIAACNNLLLKFGGHEMAAGFTLAATDIPAFRERVRRYCAEIAPPVSVPVLPIDGEVLFGDISEKNVANLSALEPFGCGNEEPVFMARNLTVNAITAMGDGHSRVTLAQGGEKLAGAVFNKTPEQLAFQVGERVDAAFVLSIYSSPYKDMISVRFRDIRRAGIGARDCDSVAAYNSLAAGRPLNEQERELLSLSREDVAAVYRGLRQKPVDRSDFGELAFRFPGITPGKAAAVLDVLEELELVMARASENGGILAAAVENPAKRDLVASSLFCELNEENKACCTTS